MQSKQLRSDFVCTAALPTTTAHDDLHQSSSTTIQARLWDLRENADENPDVEMAPVVDPGLNDHEDTLSDLYYKHDIQDSLMTLVCVYRNIVALSLACECDTYSTMATEKRRLRCGALCHTLPN